MQYMIYRAMFREKKINSIKNGIATEILAAHSSWHIKILKRTFEKHSCGLVTEYYD